MPLSNSEEYLRKQSHTTFLLVILAAFLMLILVVNTQHQLNELKTRVVTLEQTFKTKTIEIQVERWYDAEAKKYDYRIIEAKEDK